MLKVFCFVSGKLVKRSQDRLLILLVRDVCPAKLTPHASHLNLDRNLRSSINFILLAFINPSVMPGSNLH